MNIGPKQVTLTAGASVDNQFSGEIHEFISRPSVCWYAINGDANGQEVEYSIISGTDVVVSKARCNAQNRIPIWPDDFLQKDEALPGDRLVLQLRNTGAGSHTVSYAVRIEPVA
jgi:hypothetical protein